MANPFQEHGGLIMSEEQVKAFAREILFHFLVNKDPSVSDASITASIDKLESDMQEVIEKTKIEKNFTWHNPFYIWHRYYRKSYIYWYESSYFFFY